MSSSAKRISQLGRLALAVGALVLPSAGIAAAQGAPKPDPAAATQMARHFQHEDALYGVKSTSAETRTPANAMALHFKHEDSLYGGRHEIWSAPNATQMMALHFQHEDALNQAQRSASSRLRSGLPAEVAASDGFDWNDALVGAGSAVAVLLFGAAAMLAIRRSRGRLAQS
jgi:hypothetical protein